MRAPVAVLFLLSITHSGMGCNDNKPPAKGCIEVPAQTSDQDKTKALELAAKLEKLNVDASLKATFTDILKTDFQKLSDENTTLYLFLEAIDCYAQRQTPISDGLAKELMEVVKVRYATVRGLAGSPKTQLTPIEKNLISENKELSPKIFALFSKYGIQ